LREDPVMGDVIFDHVESTEINWKAGKNLTKRMVTKQQKVKPSGRGKNRGGKQGGQTKTVTVEEDVESFFRFFSPDITEEEIEDEEELQAILESDYELGLMIRDQFIPSAVTWFTGEVPGIMYGEGEDEGDDEDDGEDDGEEGEDYNSEDDEDFDPKLLPQGAPGGQAQCPQQ